MLPTPNSVEDFSKEWIEFVLQNYFVKNELDPDKIEIKSFEAKKNELQGILSTTFIVDVEFIHGDEEMHKSIFVKVPLKVSNQDQIFLIVLCI